MDDPNPEILETLKKFVGFSKEKLKEAAAIAAEKVQAARTPCEQVNTLIERFSAVAAEGFEEKNYVKGIEYLEAANKIREAGKAIKCTGDFAR